MRYEFIEAHRPMWRLTSMLKALEVTKSGYFDWRHRGESPRSSRDRALTVRIAAIHATSRRTYGSPRIHRELKASGEAVGKKRVERLMREAGISPPPRRRFTVTTQSDHDLAIAPDHLRQDFTAAAPDRRWVTDITYIPTAEGWLYLAAIMDLYSRRIVGWSMKSDLGTRLVLQALEMAIKNRRPSPGLIHHSDRGCQYASHAYRRRLDEAHMQASMSRRACCYDNAAMESFFHTLKVELIHRHDFQSREQARTAVFEYIEAFYNRSRRHSAIDYLSPVEFEQRNAANAA
jgi:transposase InsO family protein